MGEAPRVHFSVFLVDLPECGSELRQAEFFAAIIPYHLYRHVTFQFRGVTANNICEDKGSFGELDYCRNIGEIALKSRVESDVIHHITVDYSLATGNDPLGFCGVALRANDRWRPPDVITVATFLEPQLMFFASSPKRPGVCIWFW